MTRAICLRCGREKVGALTSCYKCGFVPADVSDRAKAMLLCDHCMSPVALTALGARIRAGEPARLDPEAVAAWVEHFRDHPEDERMPLACLVLPYALFAILGLLIVALVIEWALLKWKSANPVARPRPAMLLLRPDAGPWKRVSRQAKFVGDMMRGAGERRTSG